MKNLSRQNSTRRPHHLTAFTLLLTLSTVFALLTPSAWAGDDSLLYHRAKDFARHGDFEFAYMNYHNVLTDYPSSRYRTQATFAVGEYNFDSNLYPEATTAFNDYLARSSDAKGKLFALAYLLKIAESKKKIAVMRELENRIINLQQVSLVFRNHKDFTYLSPMDNHFKAVYKINTIEFYREGALFAKISY